MTITTGTSMRRRLRAAAAGVAFGIVLAGGFVVPSMAQAPQQGFPTAPDGKMLLEADELVYDFDGNTVTAVGKVQIFYGAYVLDAAKVKYDQASGRLLASGGVRILEPSGNVITSESADITDDFRDGFIASLNIETIDKAHFAAQSAERRDGNVIVLRKGVYTACQPCLDHPGRPPLWQIKAQRIIHDQQTRTIYFQNARLEFFGVPIAYTPIFFQPDPTVHRKTGFLTPSIRGSGSTGIGITTPFFWNLAPNYDLTFAPTYLSRQGALLETEWRHRILTGAYSIRTAGIFQQNKDAFRDDDDHLSGDREFRGSVRTIGDFAINSRWTTGWDISATTDRTFNRDYRIAGSTAKDLPSTIYLTGLSDANYFDARAYYFRVQRENTIDPGFDDDLGTDDDHTHSDQSEQAVVHPVIDYNYLLGFPVIGGQVRFDSNLTSLSRERTDLRPMTLDGDPTIRYAGVAGDYTRLSTRSEWQRKMIGPLGQVFTPFAYVQGDVDFIDARNSAAGLDEGASGRVMPAVGLDYEWPILATAGSSTHTFGPRVQIIVRPDEQHIGDLPNEDAQSLVFDDTSLFVYDKFSGYDRQEGGTRANYGLTYQGIFANGATVDALFGQSAQLAGRNSFDEPDHALTGIDSGLDDTMSDYVGRVTLNTGMGLAVTGRTRLDNDDLSLQRGEVDAIGESGSNIVSLGYAYLRESPGAGIFEDRQEVSAGAVVGVTANWRVSGTIVYDVENRSEVSHSIGVAYDDDCFNLAAIYSETREEYSDIVSGKQFFVRLNLRTLGDDRPTSLIQD